MANPSFFDKESACEFRFRDACERLGGLWHYCTPGHFNESVNITPEDLDFSVNNLAISAAEVGVTVLTDAHMANHLHALLGCRREQCFAVQEAYLFRLGKRLRSQNRYVIDPGYTPFSDRWSGASVYFNLRTDEAGSVSFNALPYRIKREISFRSRPVVPDSYRFCNGRMLPSSYLDYRLGESFFRDAHHYFSMLTKNAEAFSAVAKRLGDRIVLTEDELYLTVKQIAVDKYNVKQASLLPPTDKLEVAKTMHFDFNATNSQIQRMLRLDPAIIRELFP